MYDELTPAEIEAKKNNSKDNAKENNKEDAKENNKEDVKKNNKEDAMENNKEDTMENNKENAMENLVEQKKSDYIVDQPNYIEHSVSIKNANAKWLDYEREDTLQNINIKVRPGELIAIVGQVGSGKSSLLNVILNELRLREGSIKVC